MVLLDLSALNIKICFRDLTTTMSRHEFESLFRWDDILKHSPHQISVKEVSAVSGLGLSEVIEWLLQHSR